ncbi:hypothetical protein VZ95_19270, partial [Elstera litoralis]
ALALVPAWEAAEDLLLQLLLEQGKTADARARIHRRLWQRADQSDLWRLLAITLDQRDRLETAFYACQRACRFDPDNVEAHRLLGWLAHRTGRIAKAAESARRTVALTGGDVPAAIQAAFLLEAATRIGTASVAEAATLAERAVFLAPSAAEAWRALGHVRLTQHRWEDAEAALRTAVELAPDGLDAARQLAGLFLGRGRLAEAEARLLHLLRQHPEDKIGRLLLAETYQKNCRYDDGLAALAAWQDWPDGALRAAWLLADRAAPGDWAEAIALCQQVIHVGGSVKAAGEVLARLAGLGSVEAEAALDLLPRYEAWKIYRHALRVAVYRYGHGPFCRLARLAQARFPDEAWIETAAFLRRGSMRISPRPRGRRRRGTGIGACAAERGYPRRARPCAVMIKSALLIWRAISTLPCCAAC